MGKIYSLMDESTAGFTSVEIVNTFADLPPAADHYGEIYGVNTTTGSLLWPPTYKPKGMYLSNGTEWIKQPVPGFATQAETNAGVIDDKTISPKTLINSDKIVNSFQKNIDTTDDITEGVKTFVPALTGDSSQFLDGQGNFSTPPGGLTFADVWAINSINNC